MKIGVVAASAVAVAMSSSAMAADTAKTLDEVVVTATRTKMKVDDAPASVSVITEKAMEGRNVRQVSDALKDLAGVNVRDVGAGTPSAWANQVIIRGIPGYYRTAVMVDGQPINNAFSAGVNWSMVDPEAVERIEVVRGPFSSLYGGNAMGGAVNIITKAPLEREIVAKVGYGSNDTKSGHVAYGDRLSERFALRLDGGYKESDGHLKELVVREPSTGAGAAVSGLVASQTPEGNPAYIVGDKGPRKWWQKNAGGTATFDVTDFSVLTLGARYHQHETDFDAYTTYLTDTLGNPLVSDNVDVGGGQRLRLSENVFLFGANGEDALRYTAAYEHEFRPGLSMKLDAAYADNNYWYTSAGSTATASGGTGKLVDVPNSKLSLNAMVNFTPIDRHNLVAGISYVGDELNKREYDLANWRNRGTMTNLRYLSDSENRTYAAYLQDEFKARPDLTFYLGARYDYWTTEGVVQQIVAPAFRTEYDSREKSALSPKASIVYVPREGTTLRASAGKAFRAPTLSDMYSTWVASNGVVNQSNPDLDPETTTSFEIGGSQALGAATVVSGTVFHNTLEDLIYQRRLPNGDSTKENAGEAVIKGVEVEVRHRFTAAVTAFANYTYVSTEIKENAAEPASVGKRITYVPDHSASAGVDVLAGPWKGSLVGRYVGKLYSDSQNRDVVDGVFDSYEPYFTLDAKVRYRFTERFSASLAATNLLDAEYYQGGIAPGRTVFAEVVAEF